jgi:hypothetical protein
MKNGTKNKKSSRGRIERESKGGKLQYCPYSTLFLFAGFLAFQPWDMVLSIFIQ